MVAVTTDRRPSLAGGNAGTAGAANPARLLRDRRVDVQSHGAGIGWASASPAAEAAQSDSMASGGAACKHLLAVVLASGSNGRTA